MSGFEMAVGGEHVEAAIEVVVEEEDAELQRQPAGGPMPSVMASSVKSNGPGLRDVERGHLVGEVADEQSPSAPSSR